MKHYLLRGEQSAVLGGFTDLFVVNHADMTQATDNTDQVIDLDTLAMGDLVGYEALLEIRKAFDAASADEALALSVGVNGALTQFLGASAVVAAGAGTAVKTAYSTAAGGAPYVTPTGGKTLQLNCDITDADGALADHAQGEVWVWLKIIRQADREMAAPVQ